MKVAILGTAPSSNLLAPFNDPEWEIWACGPANCGVLPRIDTFFEIHGIDGMLRDKSLADYLDWVKKHPRVWMQEIRPEFPGAIRYPVESMFGAFGEYFFTSSVAYMLALAITLPTTKEIGLWGVDMSAHDEYGYQRAGCQFFIQEAKKRGIPITVPPESDILQPPPPYGYREASRMWCKMNAHWKDMFKEHQQIVAQMVELKKRQTVLEGGMATAQYVCNTWYKSDPAP